MSADKKEHEVAFIDMALEDGQLVEKSVRMIRQSDLGRCPFYIFNAAHYREDGSCKCDDAEHRAMMIREWQYKPEHFEGIPLRSDMIQDRKAEADGGYPF